MADSAFEGATHGAPATAPGRAVVAPIAIDAGRGCAVIIERAVDGDREAFEALAVASLDRSYHLALAILGNDADARDAVQEAYVAAWRGLPRLRDARCFDGWLSRIVVNACRGVRRSRTRLRIRELRVDAVAEVELASDADEAEQQAVALDAVERAFDRLTTHDRALLVLHHLERRSVEEIAATLEIPVGTVKSRLFTARRALERALERER